MSISPAVEDLGAPDAARLLHYRTGLIAEDKLAEKNVFTVEREGFNALTRHLAAQVG